MEGLCGSFQKHKSTVAWPGLGEAQAGGKLLLLYVSGLL